jgi:tRNA pseudouridine55 synthase
VDGAIVVDKPQEWTSHDVVGKLRRLAATKRVGHLGTLDPIATGVLPLLVGKATRLAQFYTRSDKIYEAVVHFGYATDTYDRAGEPTTPATEVALDRAELEARLEAFRGEFLQTPPPVSAKKVDGVRAYKLARQKVAVELAAVPVQVYELELLGVDGAEAVLRARCSGGTYMRSLAHDLGLAMGCGAHLRDLRRTLSGEFRIEQARTIPELEQLAAESRLEEALVPSANMLPDFPAVYVDDMVVNLIRQGRNFPVSPFRAQKPGRYVKAVSRGGELVAIGESVLPNLYHPAVVL